MRIYEGNDRFFAGGGCDRLREDGVACHAAVGEFPFAGLADPAFATVPRKTKKEAKDASVPEGEHTLAQAAGAKAAR